MATDLAAPPPAGAPPDDSTIPAADAPPADASAPLPTSKDPSEAERAAAERLRQVREFFFHLRKAVKNIGMYRHDPKRVPAFLEPARAALEPALASGPLAINVLAEAFAYEKEAVWGAEGPESIPGRFFREGIRQLVFKPGLPAEEFEKLVSILLANPDRGEEEILSQLFNAAFRHVGYTVAELFAFGDLSEGQVASEVEKLIADFKQRLQQVPPAVPARAGAIAQALDARLEAMERPQQPLFKEGAVVPAFQAKVRQDGEKDEAVRLYPHLVSIVLAQLKDGSLRDPAQAADVLAQLLDGMLQRGDLGPLSTVLDTLDSLKDALIPTAEIRSALGGRMSEEPRLRQLGALLNGKSPSWMGIARYLAECKPGAALVLLDVVPLLEPGPARTLVLETVAFLDKEASKVLSERLDADGAAGVANLLAFADCLPIGERTPLVEEVLRHPTPALRLEAVKLLGRTATPDATYRFALQASTDADPAVRAEAFRAMLKLSPKRTAADLMRLPKLPDWEKRPQTEKELVFDLLGQTGAVEEIVRYAQGILSQPKKGLFAGKRIETKLLAIRALQGLRSPLALQALQAVGTMPDQDPEATTAAERAATRVKLALGREPEKSAQRESAPLPQGEALAALQWLRKTYEARRPAPKPASQLRSSPSLRAVVPPPQPSAPASATPSFDHLDALFTGTPSPAAPASPATTSAAPAPAADPDSLDDLFEGGFDKPKGGQG